MLLHPDLALRREPRAEQLARQALAGLGLGEQQELVLARRQTTIGATTRAFGVSRSASHDSPDGQRLDLVRDHPVQIRRGVRARSRKRRTWDAARPVTSSPSSRPRVASVFRSRAERKVEEAGYDPARLPPGQYLTEKWPVLHAGDVASYPADLAGWDFRVYGEVDEPLTLTWAELNELPQETVTQDIHCVTRWSRFDTEFTGVPWSAIRERVGQRPSAHYAIAHAEAGFTANVPAAFLDMDGALLVTHAEGEPLTRDHGWPLRLVVPGKYFWKSAKWLRAIELRATDAPGFWERYGYPNDADPWKEQRYAF